MENKLNKINLEKTWKLFVHRDEHERIGDIIKKYGHFLKVCSVIPKKRFTLIFFPQKTVSMHDSK